MSVLPKTKNIPITARKKVVPTVLKTTVAPPSTPLLSEEAALELINRRQRQVIVHSVIYYRMNTTLISDKTFDTWGRELVQLQKTYPEVATKSVFWEDMKDFDASTGFYLADNPWGVKVAMSLLIDHNKLN